MTARRKSTINPKVIDLTLTALFAALIILMTFTPIGYIQIGPLLKLTLLTLPTAVGSVVLGRKAGLMLGGVFGLSSFFTCFGMDAFGNMLLGINPFYTFIMCVVPRLLCGFLTAVIYKAISENGTKRTWLAIPVATASTAVINTVLFLGALWLFFADQTGAESFWAFFGASAGINGLIEIAVNVVVGTAICKPLILVKKRLV